MEDNILLKLHKVEIEILDMVHKICLQNGLTYYLTEGTLLGAVRHEGFIPWDDDIDIAMPLNDYCKFIKLCQKGALGKKYMIQHTSTVSNHYLPFIKVRKRNTLFDELTDLTDKNIKGIFIDIFPLCWTKKNDGFIYHVRSKLVREISYIIFKRVFNLKSPSKMNSFLTFIMKPLSIKRMAAMRDFIAASCKKGDYYVNYGGLYGYVKETIPKDWFGIPKLVAFEDKKFFAPRESEKILSQIYGDWLTLPPVEERRNHNPTRVIFNTNIKNND